MPFLRCWSPDNRGGGLDMNVQEAWSQGYTGKGVVVTILDDGIEKDHPDLQINYDEQASYDVNGHDPDPQPRYDFSNENRHGTRCAGEVAAQADNFVCSVGVAYNARIGGVRMLDGDVTDSVEAQSLSLNTQHIHVYSASWGPDDDGRTVDGPATLARKAFYDGITKGRGGLGSIFVWASGNGGRDEDNCNCDGYTNSIFTLSISSCTEKGNVPWYSESCSSTLATTYSSGSGGEKQIVTTDLRKDCTETHTGTSASAPLAAGLIALALEANPFVTWRDMQHMVVETAKPDHLHAPDWVLNGAGKKVSHSFGFGLMDASAMVTLARNWTTVPEQHICEIRSTEQNSLVPMNGKLIVPLYTDGCAGTVNEVRYVEHVQARLTMTSSRRGEIQVSLTSPFQTRSVLLAKRTRDTSREGFNNWAFMTTHCWGEDARGEWQLEIENGASSAELKEWTLVVMGTQHHPLKQTSSAQSATANHAFTCAGVTSNGICIECKRGFYKLGQHCVSQCPHHYYGSVHTVPLYSSLRRHSAHPTPHTQGLCQACHPSCLTCRGQAASDCQQCAPGYQRQGEGGVACHKTLLWDLLDPAVMKHLAWALILCIGAVILLSILLAVWQARQRRRLCWADKPHPLPPDWAREGRRESGTPGEVTSARRSKGDGVAGETTVCVEPPSRRSKRGYSKVPTRGDPMVLSDFASHRPEEADDELSSFSNPSASGDVPPTRRTKRGYSKVCTRGDHALFTDVSAHRPEEADDEMSSLGNPAGDLPCRRSRRGYSDGPRTEPPALNDGHPNIPTGPDSELSTFRGDLTSPGDLLRHSRRGHRDISQGNDSVAAVDDFLSHRAKGGYNVLSPHFDLPDGLPCRGKDDNPEVPTFGNSAVSSEMPTTRRAKGGYHEVTSSVIPSHGQTRRIKRRHSEMSSFNDPALAVDVPPRRVKGDYSEIPSLLDDLPMLTARDSYGEGPMGALSMFFADIPSRKARGDYSNDLSAQDNVVSGHNNKEECEEEDFPDEEDLGVSCELSSHRARESCELPSHRARESCELPSYRARESCELSSHRARESCELPSHRARESCELPSYRARESCELSSHRARESCELPSHRARESCELPSHRARESCTSVPARRDPVVLTDILAGRAHGRYSLQSAWSDFPSFRGELPSPQMHEESADPPPPGSDPTLEPLSVRAGGAGYSDAWADFMLPADASPRRSRADPSGLLTSADLQVPPPEAFSRRGTKRDSGDLATFRDTGAPGEVAAPPHRGRGHHRSTSSGADPTVPSPAAAAPGHRVKAGSRRERHLSDTPLLQSIPTSLRAGKLHARAGKTHLHSAKNHAHKGKGHRSGKTHAHGGGKGEGKGHVCEAGCDGTGHVCGGKSHAPHGRNAEDCGFGQEDSIWHVPVA